MNWVNLKEIINSIIGILKGSVIPVLFTLATVYFMWGVLSYIMAADDEKEITAARSYIIYGLIGLFVIVSMWAIVGLVFHSLGASGSMPTGPNL